MEHRAKGETVSKRKKPTRLLDDPKFMARFQKAMIYWEKKMRPLKEASRKSQELTGEDMQKRVRGGGEV